MNYFKLNKRHRNDNKFFQKSKIIMNNFYWSENNSF